MIREVSQTIIVEGDVASAELPFTLNENEKGRECTSCGSEETRRIILNEPSVQTVNEHAYIPVVERKESTLPQPLGDLYMRMYQCKDCGHVDFYTHLEHGITR